jgi:putative acetyltransferase
MSTVLIRKVQRQDDNKLSELIKQVMTEIGASGSGFSIHDPEVLAMSLNYADARSGYFVLVRGEEVLGGAGFAQLSGAEQITCELRKMYFYPAARGLGKAQEMLTLIFDHALAAGYTQMYLETVESASAARKLYERNGFVQIGCAKGNTGHGGCDTFYEREL